MGACTALYYLNRTKDLSVKALILDSPYDNIENIAKNLAKTYSNIP